MKKLLIILIAVLIFSCNQRDSKSIQVTLESQFGDIEIELYPEKAPITVGAFLANVEKGYYTNSYFYRVLKADELPNDNNTGLIQGGIWQTKAELKRNEPGIIHESTKQTGLSHTSGTISLARLKPGTANTEFFICIGDQTPLDFGRRGTEDGEGFAAFGRVTKGMAIVRKIQSQKSKGDKFTSAISINKIKINLYSFN